MRHDAALEATVTSKGQITLPKRLRERLGLKHGSRIRFRLEADGGLRCDPVLYDFEDLWALADESGKPKRAIRSGQMEAAKARRRW